MMKNIFVATLLATLWAGGCASGGARRQAAAGAGPALVAPERYTYLIRAVYPHDTLAFTQGLLWADGRLWEGTGLHGRSQLREVELESGRTLRRAAVPGGDFGEGIALLDGKLYQLTWQEGRAYRYDAATLRLEATLPYRGEGWGLATDGRQLYMSDGSATIRTLDPRTFKPTASVTVTLQGRPLHNLNELEWIDGKLWANVYLTDQVAIIDPASGVVTGLVDFVGLLPEQERTPATDVLNGIAYDPSGGRIFVTGKNWPYLYQVEIVK